MRILPWNGYEGALSLTFDDGDVSQAKIALRILDGFKKKGTFFLTGKQNDFEEIWKKAWIDGHELGNHSMRHKLPIAGEEYDAYEEVVESKSLLEKRYESAVLTYAYPYSFVTDGQIRCLQNTHIGARAGDEEQVILKYEDDVDWYKIPSFVATSDTDVITYKELIEQAVEEKAWVVFMIHAIEGIGTGYEPIPQEVLKGVLAETAKTNIWVAPFGEVCAYWRAQKIVETAIRENKTENILWDVPAFFEKRTILKVELDLNEEYQLFQNGRNIVKNAEGFYEICFNEGTLQMADKKKG